MQLIIGDNQMNLTDASSGISRHDHIGISMAYPRMFMYQELTTLEAAINGLRNPQTINKNDGLLHIYIKDNNDVGKNYQKNAVVYLETVFRTIDFNTWVITTQNLFNIRIVAGIIKSSLVSGPQFSQYLENHVYLSLENEINFWSSFGISYFKLQYSNQYQIGLQENTIIENALGVTYFARIKAILSYYRGPLRLTSYMYSGFINEFKVPNGSQCLVRNSSDFFGLLNENVFKEFRSSTLSKLLTDEKFKALISLLGTYQLHPTPIQWQNTNYSFYGGNPLCGFNTGLDFVLKSFSFSDSCATRNTSTITWTPLTSLLAYVMMGGNSTTMCKPFFEMIQIDSPPSFDQLNLSYLQFISTNSTAFLSAQPLLDNSFALSGWMSIYEWVFLEREAVVFDGDNRTYTVMTAATLPQMPPYHNSPSSVAIHVWYCCCLVTFGLVGVAIKLCGLWVAYRPLGCPWFMFNRITSATCLNRSILVIRCGAAILCISSSNLLKDKFDVNKNTLTVLCI
ncbi:hypothetical protein THRCLA_10265 [Thraustotheca clavata]|uniref:Uncharacterized protein n=1 Tax=Thraustotheca clavata TaxID=74557 RepID=A0A1V9YSC7_9STRA|nr:hypothetical protein THRCLA_10265 [Thraustotheca clavata]